MLTLFSTSATSLIWSVKSLHLTYGSFLSYANTTQDFCVPHLRERTLPTSASKVRRLTKKFFCGIWGITHTNGVAERKVKVKPELDEPPQLFCDASVISIPPPPTPPTPGSSPLLSPPPAADPMHTNLCA